MSWGRCRWDDRYQLSIVHYSHLRDRPPWKVSQHRTVKSTVHQWNGPRPHGETLRPVQLHRTHEIVCMRSHRPFSLLHPLILTPEVGRYLCCNYSNPGSVRMSVRNTRGHKKNGSRTLRKTCFVLTDWISGPTKGPLAGPTSTTESL